MEGVVVEQPAEPATAGEVFGIGPAGLGCSYVGREGIVGPLMSTDAVVDVLAMDRGLFDAANAAKARTHCLRGEPGNLALIDGGGNPVENCCVLPLVPPLFVLCCLLGSLFALFDCECWCCCCCRKSTPHEDMAFPDWADRALVFTDKGVVGRQEFTGKVNAITWDGFRIEDVRIRTFDAPCLCTSPHYWLCCVGRRPEVRHGPIRDRVLLRILSPLLSLRVLPARGAGPLSRDHLEHPPERRRVP